VSTAVDLDSTPPGAPPGKSGRRVPATGHPQPRRRRGDWLRTLARGIGQTLITFGLVALLFVGYELWVTDLIADQRQAELTEQIRAEWLDDPTVAPTDPGTEAAPLPPGTEAPAPGPAPAPIDVGVGEPFAILHIPALGDDYAKVVVEGASGVELENGPGHYLDTAMPGELGNFAVAGHRVGRGAPFLDVDRLRPGDPIVVETSSHWFVYRVLGDPATGSFAGDPSGIPGQEIVRPSAVEVIAPTPGAPGAPATDAYLTLTTCHPKYSAQQRLIIHARLDGAPVSKATAPDGPPALGG
jgi:sortase A